MRNQYPKPCGICQGWVPAEEGVLQGSRASGWTVTHAGACPKGSVRHGHAQAYTRRALGILRRTDSTADETETAVSGLAALVRTGWASSESCERRILEAPAFRDLLRWEVEEILDKVRVEYSRC